MIICFNGIDGAGKSLQANRLVDQLNAAGHPAVYVWTGGTSPVMKPLIRLGQRILRAPVAERPDAALPPGSDLQYRSYLNSTGRLFKNSATRNLWLHVSLLEHAAEIWARVLLPLRAGNIVICDRYLYDTIIGVSVLANLDASAIPPLVRQARFYKVPRPDKWFFLDLPAATAFSRKRDIPDVLFLERRIPLYKALATSAGMQVIDASGTPDEIAATIWHEVQPLLTAQPAPTLSGATK